MSRKSDSPRPNKSICSLCYGSKCSICYGFVKAISVTRCCESLGNEKRLLATVLPSPNGLFTIRSNLLDHEKNQTHENQVTEAGGARKQICIAIRCQVGCLLAEDKIQLTQTVLSMEPNANDQADWIVFQRIQEVKSASQINLIRFVSVTLFFSILTGLYLAAGRPEEQTKYWLSSARVCGIWLVVVSLVVVALKRRKVPSILKYATSLCDVVLLTTIASVGAKAESTLVIAFFIIVASTFLRLSIKLILSATALCIVAYLGLVYQTDHFWSSENFRDFPYLKVCRTVGGLIVMGLIGWQLCRSCRFGVETLVGYERLRGSNE